MPPASLVWKKHISHGSRSGMILTVVGAPQPQVGPGSISAHCESAGVVTSASSPA